MYRSFLSHALGSRANPRRTSPLLSEQQQQQNGGYMVDNALLLHSSSSSSSPTAAAIAKTKAQELLLDFARVSSQYNSNQSTNLQQQSMQASSSSNNLLLQLKKKDDAKEKDDAGIEAMLIETTKELLHETVGLYLDGDFETGNMNLQLLFKVLEPIVPKASMTYVSFFANVCQAMGYYLMNNWKAAIKCINPIISNCPKVGRYYANGLSDLLLMLSECYSQLGSSEDALLSSRLAVSTLYERFELMNQEQQVQHKVPDSFPLWLRSSVVPCIHIEAAFAASCYALGNQLEANAMAQLAEEWYNRSLLSSLRIGMPSEIVDRIKNALDENVSRMFGGFQGGGQSVQTGFAREGAGMGLGWLSQDQSVGLDGVSSSGFIGTGVSNNINTSNNSNNSNKRVVDNRGRTVSYDHMVTTQQLAASAATVIQACIRGFLQYRKYQRLMAYRRRQYRRLGPLGFGPVLLKSMTTPNLHSGGGGGKASGEGQTKAKSRGAKKKDSVKKEKASEITDKEARFLAKLDEIKRSSSAKVFKGNDLGAFIRNANDQMIDSAQITSSDRPASKSHKHRDAIEVAKLSGATDSSLGPEVDQVVTKRLFGRSLPLLDKKKVKKSSNSKNSSQLPFDADSSHPWKELNPNLNHPDDDDDEINSPAGIGFSDEAVAKAAKASQSANIHIQSMSHASKLLTQHFPPPVSAIAKKMKKLPLSGATLLQENPIFRLQSKSYKSSEKVQSNSSSSVRYIRVLASSNRSANKIFVKDERVYARCLHGVINNSSCMYMLGRIVTRRHNANNDDRSKTEHRIGGSSEGHVPPIFVYDVLFDNGILTESLSASEIVEAGSIGVLGLDEREYIDPTKDRRGYSNYATFFDMHTSACQTLYNVHTRAPTTRIKIFGFLRNCAILIQSMIKGFLARQRLVKRGIKITSAALAFKRAVEYCGNAARKGTSTDEKEELLESDGSQSPRFNVWEGIFIGNDDEVEGSSQLELNLELVAETNRKLAEKASILNSIRHAESLKSAAAAVAASVAKAETIKNAAGGKFPSPSNSNISNTALDQTSTTTAATTTNVSSTSLSNSTIPLALSKSATTSIATKEKKKTSSSQKKLSNSISNSSNSSSNNSNGASKVPNPKSSSTNSSSRNSNSTPSAATKKPSSENNKSPERNNSNSPNSRPISAKSPAETESSRQVSPNFKVEAPKSSLGEARKEISPIKLSTGSSAQEATKRVVAFAHRSLGLEDRLVQIHSMSCELCNSITGVAIENILFRCSDLQEFITGNITERPLAAVNPDAFSVSHADGPEECNPDYSSIAAIDQNDQSFISFKLVETSITASNALDNKSNTSSNDNNNFNTNSGSDNRGNKVVFKDDFHDDDDEGSTLLGENLLNMAMSQEFNDDIEDSPVRIIKSSSSHPYSTNLITTAHASVDEVTVESQSTLAVDNNSMNKNSNYNNYKSYNASASEPTAIIHRDLLEHDTGPLHQLISSIPPYVRLSLSFSSREPFRANCPNKIDSCSAGLVVGEFREVFIFPLFYRQQQLQEQNVANDDEYNSSKSDKRRTIFDMYTCVDIQFSFQKLPSDHNISLDDIETVEMELAGVDVLKLVSSKWRTLPIPKTDEGAEIFVLKSRGGILQMREVVRTFADLMDVYISWSIQSLIIQANLFQFLGNLILVGASELHLLNSGGDTSGCNLVSSREGGLRPDIIKAQLGKFIRDSNDLFIEFVNEVDSLEAVFQHLLVNWELDVRRQTSKEDDKDDIEEEISDGIKSTVETLCSKLAQLTTLLVPSTSALASNTRSNSSVGGSGSNSSYSGGRSRSMYDIIKRDSFYEDFTTSICGIFTKLIEYLGLSSDCESIQLVNHIEEALHLICQSSINCLSEFNWNEWALKRNYYYKLIGYNNLSPVLSDSLAAIMHLAEEEEEEVEVGKEARSGSTSPPRDRYFGNINKLKVRAVVNSFVRAVTCTSISASASNGTSEEKQ